MIDSTAKSPNILYIFYWADQEGAKQRPLLLPEETPASLIIPHWGALQSFVEVNIICTLLDGIGTNQPPVTH